MNHNKNGVIASYKQMVKVAIGDVIGKQPIMNYKHKIYAMDIDNGEFKWKKTLGEGQMVSNNKSGAPMFYKDKIFVGSPITKSFYAFNANNGEQLWNYPSNINKAPPVADNNIVYFTDTKGLVYGFNTESGELLGKKLLGGKLAPSGPILVHEYLMVGSQDSNLYTVPTKEILSSNDTSKDNEKGILTYIFFIYVLPVVILIILVVSLLLLIKKLRKFKES